MSLFITLLGLSLLDSTSTGTLVLPLLMVVVARRVYWANLGIYLGTVVSLYFAVGLVLLLGAGVAVEAVGDLLDTRPVFWAQLVLGVGLVVLSFRMEGGRSDEGTLQRMVGGERTPRAMVGLGVAAVGMEIVSMMPYLGAIGLLSASDLGWPVRIATLAVYCLVMVLPALAIIGLVSLMGDRLWNRVERFAGWIARQTEETVAWIVGIVGFLLAADALNRLQLF